MKITYKTSDLALATYLAYEGFKIGSIEDEMNDRGRMRKVFSFEGKTGKKITDVVEKYQRRETEVEPQKYFDEMKILKSRIYQ